MSSERFEHSVVGPRHTVGRALQAMDESGSRIVFVIDDERRLLGVMTDGDVRRWILSGKSLDASVIEAMNADPVALQAGAAPEEIRTVMLERRIESVPLVDPERRLVDAVWWPDLFEEGPETRGQLDVPVVIMAGGKGQRLSPYTNILPKPLMPIGERTILELIMEGFSGFGIRDFHISVNYKADLIAAYFQDIEHPYSIDWVREAKPLGTGGSLALLKGRLDRTFIVTNCDILVDADYADIVRHHEESGNRITLVASTKHFTIPYGVCDVGEKGTLERIREKPEFNYLVSTGFYVLEPSVLDELPDDTFMHLTDIINDHLERGLPVGVYPVSEGSWADIGEFESLQDTLRRFGIG